MNRRAGCAPRKGIGTAPFFRQIRDPNGNWDESVKESRRLMKIQVWVGKDR